MMQSKSSMVTSARACAPNPGDVQHCVDSPESADGSREHCLDLLLLRNITSEWHYCIAKFSGRLFLSTAN